MPYGYVFVVEQRNKCHTDACTFDVQDRSADLPYAAALNAFQAFDHDIS